MDYVTVKQYADEKELLFFELSTEENACINVEPAIISFTAKLLRSHSQT